ncbi:MAG: DUF2089 domain-containing protein [Chloroflexi bacterium]|nr:DUF2089 domain-containing protein [Chloroflexota bacterium]MBI3741056.1 DUF2089 domain-containing protein [Chloroflexota bacterium]
MNPIFGKCPVCGEELRVTKMECRSCGTEIGGQFAITRLARLSASDVEFVETFIKNRGNAYKVGEELEMPYSSVRARLTEIIRAMGYEPGAEPKDEPIAISPEKRKTILQDLARGKISADDAVRFLQGEAE